jgi:8-oxo-dGTP pyrophosphatase MutT (NUDIX family)
MVEPTILAKGPFDVGGFGIEILAEEWRPPAGYEALVAAQWDFYARLAAERGDRLWDGTAYRVANAQVFSQAAPITLQLGTIAYRYAATYRRLEEEHRSLGLEPLNHISIAALLRTSDDIYLFGRRRVRGNVDLIGGGVQPGELAITCGTDIASTLLKEIREETGIAPAQIGAVRGLGVVSSSTTNILIIAHADLLLTRDEALASFESREEDEMGSLECLPAAALRDYLRAMTDYRTLVADLL